MSTSAGSPSGRRSSRTSAALVSVLVGGCAPADAARLRLWLADRGYACEEAGTFEETLRALERRSFDLWIFESEGLRLYEPMVWASLRFACDRSGTRNASKPAQAITQIPVLVLVRKIGAEALKPLSAAASTPSITGWNRSGWNLGVQEWPCSEERLAALVAELLGAPAPRPRPAWRRRDTPQAQPAAAPAD